MAEIAAVGSLLAGVATAANTIKSLIGGTPSIKLPQFNVELPQVPDLTTQVSQILQQLPQIQLPEPPRLTVPEIQIPTIQLPQVDFSQLRAQIEANQVLTDQARQIISQALEYYQQGKLIPSLQAQLDEWYRNAKKVLDQKLAAAGLTNSSVAAQAYADLENQYRANAAQYLQNQLFSALGMANIPQQQIENIAKYLQIDTNYALQVAQLGFNAALAANQLKLQQAQLQNQNALNIYNAQLNQAQFQQNQVNQALNLAQQDYLNQLRSWQAALQQWQANAQNELLRYQIQSQNQQSGLAGLAALSGLNFTNLPTFEDIGNWFNR